LSYMIFGRLKNISLKFIAFVPACG